MADKLLEVKGVSKIFRVGGMLRGKKLVAVDNVSLSSGFVRFFQLFNFQRAFLNCFLLSAVSRQLLYISTSS